MAGSLTKAAHLKHKAINATIGTVLADLDPDILPRAPAASFIGLVNYTKIAKYPVTAPTAQARKIPKTPHIGELQ